MKSILCFLINLALLATSLAEECSEKDHKVYTECGANCGPTCEHPFDFDECEAICESGCVCDEGYFEDKDGNCVLLEKCYNFCAGRNEKFSDCGTKCPKFCNNRTESIECTDDCVQGCFCEKGFVRDSNKICIKEEECDVKNCTDPNEIFSECGTACQKNCFNYDRKIICNKRCVRGCFCKEGFIRGADGKCIKPESCPSSSSSSSNSVQPSCRCNEIYSDCGANGCQNTCAEPNLITYCDPIPGCFPGCVCKEGFLRDSNNTCVPKDQCNVQVCPAHEEYTKCGNIYCQKTCGPSIPCGLPPNLCDPGCLCQAGYVRKTPLGPCILESDCPAEIVCTGNEKYSYCGANECQNTCANPTLSEVCRGLCIQGCVCKEGFLRDSNNTCVPKDQCNSQVCTAAHEEFSQCKGGYCQKTCGPPIPCALPPNVCSSGCVCKAGYVRKIPGGPCVSESDCPAEIVCTGNEEFSYCGANGCQNTCANPTLSEVCRGICTQGCVCKEGFLRDSNNTCVPKDKCNVQECTAAHEEYTKCGNIYCQKTCGPPIPCGYPPDKCDPGCICQAGYVRKTPLGPCILESDCPAEIVCTGNEKYSYCGANECQNTCANPTLSEVCRGKCTQGCVCKEGFLRDSNNTCVPKDQCNVQECTAAHEEFSQCKGGNCQKTCGPPIPCALPPNICSPGCVCKAGYVRKIPGGPCVSESDCLDKTCPAHEVFSDCGAYCQRTCGPPTPCARPPQDCNPGCVCEAGYVRKNQGGPCVPESNCLNNTICREHQIFTTCGSACPLTCENKDNPPICTLQCVEGCFCEKGYVNNCNGDCVLPADCPNQNEICNLPIVVGPCKALIPKWAYSSIEKKCVKFNYGGCDANENNFASEGECKAVCP